MEKQNSRNSQLVFSTLSVGIAIFLLGDSRAAAASEYSFSISCSEIKADGISEELNVFVRRAENFSPMYKVFQNSDATTIAVSGLSKDCALVATTKNGAWNASETFEPVTGRTEYMTVRSRKKAEASYWAAVEICSKDPERFLAKAYYRDKFLKDFSLSDSYEAPSICTELLTYASQSLILEYGGGSLVVDIVAGEVFIGEIN
jgi:hypothetical protein